MLNPNNLSRDDLIDMRVKCDNDLLYFTRLFHYALKGSKFILNSHHEVIRDELRKVESYELDLLNINIPPRFSKTLLCAVNFIARGVGQNPLSNWLYITASDELRSQTSIEIRDIVTHPLFKALYGVELKKDQNGKNLWRTKEGGGLKTATIFGQITGFGAGIMRETLDLLEEFDGSIVIDDANKTDDSAVENVNNDKVSRVFFNTILSRKNTNNTPIINIQQRAGMSDLTAQLMEHYSGDPRASFLVMPVVNKDGTPLWEWKHNLEDIHKLKTSPKTAHTFETQYMQNPVPSDDVVFPSNGLNYFSLSNLNTQNIEYRCGAIDVADEGIDYLSFPIGVLIGFDFYVTDWVFSQENTEYTVPLVASKIKEHKLDFTICETNNHGSQFIRNLGAYTNAEIGGIVNTANKHSRIIQQAQTIRLRFWFRDDVETGSDYEKAMTQLTRYAKKKGSNNKDDAPDGLALLASLVREQYPDKFY